MKQETQFITIRQKLKNSKPNYWIAPSVKGLTAKFTDDEILYVAENIIDSVCKYFNVTPKELRMRKRNRELVDPRHICMYLIKMKTNMQVTKIGDLFDRDHTTVLHGVKSVKNQLTHPADDRFRDIIGALHSIV